MTDPLTAPTPVIAAYDRLAAVLDYPALTPAAPAGAQLADAAAEQALARCLAELAALSPEAREELFVQTFDMNPDRALEVGWHLFGETYDRGAFLVEMRALLREYGVEETAELPDHLGHLLRLVGRMPHAAAANFACGRLLPALRKLRAKGPEADNPYSHGLDAVERALTADFAPPTEV